MRFQTLSEASAIYTAAGSCAISRRQVSDALVERMGSELRELMKQVQDFDDMETWSKPLSYLRRSHFLVRATPLSSADPALGLLANLSLAREVFEDCRHLYPEAVPAIDATCDALSEVIFSNLDPFSEIVADAFDGSNELRFGVVLATYGLDRHVQTHLRRRLESGDVDVITPRELAARRPYDVLCVVGSPGWYARKGWGWVFTAARAEQLIVVGYTEDANRPLPAQNAFSQSRTGARRFTEEPPALPRSQEQLDDFQGELALVSEELARRAVHAHPGELADGRLYLLADGFAAFLPTTDEARIQTLEPDALPGQRMVVLPPSDIEPGAFVVLRSEGGGDLVAVVADALLGDRASTLRRAQLEWKQKLREHVESRSVQEVVGDLKANGSKIANRTNLANWCSPRSLRTSDPDDFRAIMRTLGLESDSTKYWNLMGELDSAHRKAGFEIREQLEDQVEASDLSVLEAIGRADFTLPQGGGALTAFRVEEISPDTARVPEQQLSNPMKVIG